MNKSSRRKLSFSEHRKTVQKLSKIQDEDEIRQLLTLLFNQNGFNLKVEKYKSGCHLWRVVDLQERGRVVADFGYPPKPEHCGLGRCNKAGQQVLYTSPNLGTCFSETKQLEIGAQVRAGFWEVKEDFFCFNISQSENQKSKSSKVYQALVNMYDNIGEEHYERTSVTTDWILNDLSKSLARSIPNTEIKAFRYPSTIRNEDDDQFTNFVFSKDFVDTTGIELVEWHHMEVTEVDSSSCVVRSISTGSLKKEDVSEEGQLVWRENPPGAQALIPPGMNVTFTFNGSEWVPDQPIEVINPFNKLNW